MEKFRFHPKATVEIKSYVCSYALDKDIIYFGLKDGTISYGSIKEIEVKISLEIIDSVNSKPILGILTYVNEDGKDALIAFDEGGSFLIYIKDENKFIFFKEINLKEEKINLVVVKNNYTSDKLLIMIDFNDGNYPLILNL